MNQPSGFRRVVRDIADLCELQLELFAIDGKTAANRGSTAAVMIATSSLFFLSAAVATVLALASLLHEHLQWTISNSLLAAAATAAVVGGLIAIIGLVILKNALSSLKETQSELAENLRWIKAVIVTPEISPRSQTNESSSKASTAASFARPTAVNGNLKKSQYSK